MQIPDKERLDLARIRNYARDVFPDLFDQEFASAQHSPDEVAPYIKKCFEEAARYRRMASGVTWPTPCSTESS